MKISACMIVKNEEGNISRCLQSLVGNVDEIAIIDTGSTDGTVDQIEAIRDQLEAESRGTTMLFKQVPWNGSFADMRNMSMDMATGDALFIIDGDEYVPPGANWHVLRNATSEPNFVCAVIRVFNKAPRGTVVGEPVMQPRLFINHSDIRYRFSVHNQIDDAYLSYAKRLKEERGIAGLIAHCEFGIIHLGYDLTPEERIRKYEPRVAYCEREVDEARQEGRGRDLAYFQYQLALYLAMLGRIDESADLWNSIEYDDMNTFNKWYARYVAARTFVSYARDAESREDALQRLSSAIIHSSGMFEAMYERVVGVDPVAEEPVSWFIAGIALADYAEHSGDMLLREDGVCMMIEAYLRACMGQVGHRCVLDTSVLYNDIRRQFDPDTSEYDMLDTAIQSERVYATRTIQQSIVGGTHKYVEEARMIASSMIKKYRPS